jgi:hypothetical protein
MTILIDGRTINFADARAVVQYLFDTARLPSASPEAYMLDFAARAAIERDADIRAYAFDEFVSDLIAYGYLTRVN